MPSEQPRCYICCKPTDNRDRVPFRGGVVHATCAVSEQLKHSMTGKVLMNVGRRGKWAK